MDEQVRILLAELGRQLASQKKLGADEDINTNDTSTPTQVPVSSPITHARARQLNHQVSSLLSSYPSYLDHEDACTLVLVSNQAEDQKGK